MSEKDYVEESAVYCLSDAEKLKFVGLMRAETALGRLTHDEVMALFPFMEARNFWVCVEEKVADMPRPTEAVD